jgi:superfamily II DNA/RNA helicase
MVVDLPDKMNVLWSFIKTHLNSKTLVFMSTCKEVKILTEMDLHTGKTKTLAPEIHLQDKDREKYTESNKMQMLWNYLTGTVGVQNLQGCHSVWMI